MKKSAFFILVLSISAAWILFTSMARNKTVSVTGQINYYGNSPVETPAFKSDDGNIYLMEIEVGAKFTMEELLSHQGERLELTGIIEQEKEGLAFPLSQNGTIFISTYKRAK